MSIKGMTDHAPMFPTIGLLRKGAKKTSESKPGADLTYLRFDSEDTLAVQMFGEAYPDQDALRNIHVFLPNKTADENMESWIEEWVAGGLVHRCDGETKVLWRKPTGGYSTEPKPCESCNGKQVGRLSVIVPELGRLACVTILTTSIHDIIKLTQQLRAYEALRGDLRGIPFIIRRRKEKVSTPEIVGGKPTGKRVRREKWLLSIETQPEWTMLQLSAMQQAALPAGDLPDIEEGSYSQVPNITNPFEEVGEVVDDETGEVLAPVPTAPESNGHKKYTRPLSPQTLKDMLKTKAASSGLKEIETNEWYPVELHPFGEKTAQILASRFQAAFTGDLPESPEAMYKTCLFWLTGHLSAKELTAAWADVLLDWLVGKENKSQKFSAQVVGFSATEARAIYDQVLADEAEAKDKDEAERLFADDLKPSDTLWPVEEFPEEVGAASYPD